MATIDNPVLNVCCQQSGKSVVPVVWCSECKQALCRLCQKRHERSNDSINHDVISMDNFLKLPSYLQSIKTICDKHNLRFDSYCLKDQVLLCKMCKTQKHGECSTKTLSDATRNVKSSVAIDSLKQNIHDTMQNFEKVIENRHDNVTSLRKDTTRIQQEIKQIRHEINSALDKMERKIIEKFSGIEKECSYELSRIIKDIDLHKKKIDDMKCKLDFVQTYATDLQTFIGIRIMDKILSEENEYLQSLLDSNKLEDYEIVININKRLQDFQKDVAKYGDIDVLRRPQNISFVSGYACKWQAPIRSHNALLQLSQRFDVELPTSSTVRVAAFCQLADGTFVFLDDTWRIIIHNNDGSFSSHFKIEVDSEYRPMNADLTQVDNSIIACSGSDTLYLINIQNRKIKKAIKCIRNAYGIERLSDKKLLTCIYGYGVQLIDLTDLSQNMLLDIRNPSHVKMSRNNICVTDFYLDAVNMFDNKGNRLWTFLERSTIISVSKVTADAAGNVYVVGRASKNVVFISHDGKRSRQLLVKEDFPGDSWADLEGIHYNVKKNLLIIVNMCGKVMIYNVQNKDL